MANYSGLITDFVAGDNLIIERTVITLPSGTTMAKAWFTVKKKFTDSDANAVFQKVITTALIADGQIDDTGADGTGHFTFNLIPADTVLLNPLSDYQYDIQLLLSDSSVYTPELGVITALPQVTRNTS